MAKKSGHQKKRRFSWRRFFKVGLVYFTLFLAIFGMVDYYAMMAFNFLWFVALAAVLAAVLGYLHVKRGRHDHVDDVADELF
ncbi:hypothetical protein [Hydrogenimonas sp.]